MGSHISFKPTEDALKNLSEGLSISAPTPLERDGIVQRFEYSYELIWKLSQRILRTNEIKTDTPKAVFRELGRIGWITNVESWMEFQKSRNETSHEYGERLAVKSVELAKIFLPMALELLSILRKK